MRKSQYFLFKAFKFNQGFTLIELMVVVAIIAILATIVLPSYQHFVRRGVAAQAQQEIAKLSEQLQRYKSRNFSYKGFNASYLYTGGSNFSTSNQTLTLNPTYTLTIVDGGTAHPLLTDGDSLGNVWVIKAESSDARNYSFLLTSTGLRCKNKTSSLVTYSACGVGSEDW
ncbi:prepilin-type N-terminal cleavage/methylation domain-containing protein [Acinetobacter pseudolwoffii]|uniref:type IV pilin protein n=1 Tax=Acinetobacter pseudolwoffii TaxID=2053287 RepID=UPI002578FF18|nr:prepilin-type N-terminal cleavage/methylation domain-containing protein [Acinetobacter pseudolwoffii]MDM1344478.1 prepilin-type N-terminal cleavage/methylation domain-containing protein [Acinetobacter pseudolwoffii]